jgi:hypothetical protein
MLQINNSGSHAKLFLPTISVGITVKRYNSNNSQTHNNVEATLQLHVPAATLPLSPNKKPQNKERRSE